MVGAGAVEGSTIGGAVAVMPWSVSGMNAERLLEHFNRVADMPDAVPRLRRFVLDLAVRGKLVDQDPTDEPASELLERIALGKATLKRETGDRRIKQVSDPQKDDYPVPLPVAWHVQCFGNLFLFIDYRGRTPPKTNGGIPLITAKNVRSGVLNREPREFIDEVTYSTWMTRGLPRIGDLFFTTEAPLGNVCLNDIEEPFALAQRVICLRPYGRINTRYFMFAIMSNVSQSLIREHSTGLTAKGIKSAKLKLLPIPVPPFEEQFRIAARVDELMVLCNQLNEAQAVREKTRNRLSRASYGRLSVPDEKNITFRSDACFAFNSFPTLTARADQLKRLRQAILNFAIRGKLVERSPDDELASDLLIRIEEEKTRLVKTGAIKRRKAPIALDEDENPFQLPKAWAWTQITKLGVISPRNDFPDNHVASFVPMRMIPAEYGASNTCEPRPWGEIRKGYTHFAEGDVGLAKITPCFENGKSVVFRNLTGGIGSGTTELHVLRPILVNADYVVLFLKSSLFIENGIQRMTGTAGQKRVPMEYFTNSPFPLPPLAEQRRIVGKVNELMILCNRLESEIHTVKLGCNRLFEMLIREVLEHAEPKCG